MGWSTLPSARIRSTAKAPAICGASIRRSAATSAPNWRSTGRTRTRQFRRSGSKTSIPEEGDFARPNPNSAVVWHYSGYDQNGDGKIDFDETLHRTLGSVAIKDDILYIADYSGVFHCLNAKTGKPNWSYDMLSASWGSPLIVEGKVYIGDEDGDVSIFRHSADPKVAMKKVDDEMQPYYGRVNMGNSVYSTPVVAGNVLYIANRTYLFAIANGAKPVQANNGAVAQNPTADKAAD